jgi:hypothetical protein
MHQYPQALKFALAGTVGIVAAILLSFAMVHFSMQSAEATPALANGKACKTCHASSKPSKSDLKRKKRRSDIWPDEMDIVTAHYPFMR